MIDRRDLIRSSLSGVAWWIGARAVNAVAVPFPAGESPEEVERKVYSIVAEQLGLECDEIAPDAHLVHDLCADSLDLVEIVMAVEDGFGLEIPDERAEKLVTVGDILRLLLGDAGEYDSSGQRLGTARLEVREAQVPDLWVLAEITSRAWQASHQGILPPAMLALGTARFFWKRWAELLESRPDAVSCPVLLGPHCIVGVAACGPYRRDVGPPGGEVEALLSRHRYGEIYQGYVRSSPGMRRHAELMFEVCLERLHSLGFERASLWTHSANRALVDFAASMGGVRVASRPAFVLDRVVPDQQDVLYAFQLT